MSRGEVITARFATLNVVDHDGDVIRPRAIGMSKINAGLYNHVLAGPTPAGYGDNYEEIGEAFATMTYITDTFAGRETYTYLKAMADAGRPVEWSMAYYVTKGRPLSNKDPLYEPNVGFWGKGPFEIQKMDIVSVDPMERDAGITTTTVKAKCEGCRTTGRCESGQSLQAMIDAAVEKALAARDAYV